MYNPTVRDILNFVPAGSYVIIDRDAIDGVDIGAAPVPCASGDSFAILRSDAVYLDYPVGANSLTARNGNVRIVAHPTKDQEDDLREKSRNA